MIDINNCKCGRKPQYGFIQDKNNTIFSNKRFIIHCTYCLLHNSEYKSISNKKREKAIKLWNIKMDISNLDRRN